MTSCGPRPARLRWRVILASLAQSPRPGHGDDATGPRPPVGNAIAISGRQPLGHQPMGDVTGVAQAATAHADGMVGLGITAMCLPVIASEAASRRIPIVHLWCPTPGR